MVTIDVKLSSKSSFIHWLKKAVSKVLLGKLESPKFWKWLSPRLRTRFQLPLLQQAWWCHQLVWVLRGPPQSLLNLLLRHHHPESRRDPLSELAPKTPSKAPSKLLWKLHHHPLQKKSQVAPLLPPAPNVLQKVFSKWFLRQFLTQFQKCFLN